MTARLRRVSKVRTMKVSSKARIVPEGRYTYLRWGFEDGPQDVAIGATCETYAVILLQIVASPFHLARTLLHERAVRVAGHRRSVARSCIDCCRSATLRVASAVHRCK